MLYMLGRRTAQGLVRSDLRQLSELTQERNVHGIAAITGGFPLFSSHPRLPSQL